MAEYELKCQGCGVDFVARSPLKKWHAPGCKKAAQRKAAASVKSDASVVDHAGDGADHKPTANSTYGRDVLAAVRSELEAAGRLDSVDGRVAMYLARKSIDPDCKNPAAMFKEMRAALATALAGAETAGGPDPEPEPEDDEVTRARKSREEARQAAGLA